MKIIKLDGNRRLKIKLDFILTTMELKKSYMVKLQEKRKWHWKTLSHAWLDNFNSILENKSIEETYSVMVEYLEYAHKIKEEKKYKTFEKYVLRKSDENI